MKIKETVIDWDLLSMLMNFVSLNLNGLQSLQEDVSLNFELDSKIY